MKEIMKKEKEFEDLIHVIRGQQVMLDSDLARLYGYEVKNLNKQVSRNIEKFPDDFMFQLTSIEMENVLRFQLGTSSSHGGRRYAPYAFTEQGIYMLASILRGETATQQSIYIMRSFKEMKHYLAENKLLVSTNELLSINHRLDKHEVDINKIMDNFIVDSNVKQITILNGQKFEANEAYIAIYKQAKQTIFLFDDYINIDTLSLLKNKHKNIDVTIFSDNKGYGKHKLQKLEINNFNEQYPSLTIQKNGICHDRYIILDYDTKDEKIYHCGASSKDAGKKVCSINQIEDTEIFHTFIKCH